MQILVHVVWHSFTVSKLLVSVVSSVRECYRIDSLNHKGVDTTLRLER
jgi:hypothetical protein